MPSLSCRVLGPVRVTVAGMDAPAELLWRKHVALLVYLARSPRKSRTRAHLVGLLWSDRDEPQARHSLSEALRVLRRVLGDEGIQADVDQVRLSPDAVALDCDRFAELCGRGEWADAAALVDGEFLEGLAIPGASEFENWVAAERTLWRTQGLEALVQEVEAHLARGDMGAAARAGLRAIALDRTSEPAARAAMRALALAGDRAAALRVADELAHTLRAAVGAGVSGETARLIERVRDARVGRRVVAAAPAARPRPPLVGRAVEMAALSTAWQRARRGRGQVVIVEGEPGEGKTRLFEELVAQARLHDATVVTTRAVPADQATRWSALTGLLAGGLGEAPGLAGAPPGALAGLAALDPDLRTKFGTAAAAIPTDDALRAAMRAVAAERPLLVALDDAQWCDVATLAALPALARDAAARPVFLLLGVSRGSPLPEGDRLDQLRARLGRDLEGAVVRLGPLDAVALQQLVRWALPHYGSEDVERLTRRVERDTAGIPLLAVGMLEAVAAGFAPPPASHAPAWPSPKRTLVDSLPGELPPAVIGAVCLRFRALPEAAQQMLGAAAALDGRVDADVLARATGRDRVSVEQGLDVLEWDRWLVADARGYVFTAPIERAILLQEMITPGQARRFRANAHA
jgi:DNA-binding SARP family transcriptional activator